MKFINKRLANFTTLPNEIILDKSISWKAKGILAYMLSRPIDWQFYISEILKHCPDGRDAVRAGIEELIQACYIKRYKDRDQSGQFCGYVYEVYDTPNKVTRIEDFDSTLTQDKQEDLAAAFWQVNKDMAEREVEGYAPSTGGMRG